MKKAGGNINIADIEAVLSQLNSAILDKNLGKWAIITTTAASVCYRLSVRSSYDAVIYWYLCALGVKRDEGPVGGIDANTDQTDSEVFDIKFDSATLLEFKERDHFSVLKNQELRRCHDAIHILRRIFSKYIANISFSMQPTGPIYVCEGSLANISLFELICVLYKDKELGFNRFGLELHFIKERCDNKQFAFHVDFQSVYNTSFSSLLAYTIKDENHPLIKQAIDKYITLKEKHQKCARYLTSIPIVPLDGIKDITPLLDKQELLRRHVEHLAYDVNNHKKLLQENFIRLTADIFPSAKWVGIVEKQGQLIFTLTNLTDTQISIIYDAFRHVRIGCHVCLLPNQKFLKFSKLTMLEPKNLKLWHEIFVEKKTLLKSLIQHEKLLNVFRIFNDKIKMVDLQFDINKNTPVIRFVGVSIELVKAYVFSWQMTTPKFDSPAVDIIFNLERFPCRIEESQFSEENAQSLLFFDKAFRGLWEIVYNVGGVTHSSIKYDSQEVVYNFKFSDKSSLEHVKLFFSYLNYRYQQLCFTAVISKKSNALTVKVTGSDSCVKNLRGLFVSDALPKLANDSLPILKDILCEMPAVKKKYRANISWENVSVDLKLALGRKLVSYIKNDCQDSVKSFFEFAEWDLYAHLPGVGKKDAMTYAQEIGADNIYRYLHKKFTEDTSRQVGAPITSFVANPGSIGRDLMGFLGQMVANPNLLPRIPDDFYAHMEQNQVNAVATATNAKPKRSAVKKIEEEPAAFKFLQSFCQSASLPASWQLITKDLSQCVQLTHNIEIGIGLLYDYFYETGLECEWQNTILSMSLEELNRWHADIFSEQRDGVYAIEANVERMKQRGSILAALLSIARPIIGISDWHATAIGCECIFREAAKTENLDHYSAKRTNTLVMLDWTRLQCSLIENPLIMRDQIDATVLHLNYAAPRQPEWLKLLDNAKIGTSNRSLLKNCRILASAISSMPTPLLNVNSIDQLLVQETLKMQQAKQTQSSPQKQDEFKVKPVPPKKDKPKNSSKTNKGHNASHKPKVSKVSNTDVAKPGSSKANSKKDRGPHIAPQDTKRWQLIDTIRSAPHAGLSAPAGRGIDLSLFAPAKVVQAGQMHRQLKDPLLELPEPITLEESEILAHLDNWLAQMDQVVNAYQAYCQQENLDVQSQLTAHQQEEIHDFATAWHNLHAEIASLLAVLSHEHPAKMHLFNQHLYNGRRTYDRQKHNYFPPVISSLVEPQLFSFPSQCCLLNVDGIRSAITFIMKSNHPLEQSLAKSVNIIQSWSRYLEAEFDNYNIVKLTEDMDAKSFTKWLQTKVRQYTVHIQKLLTKPDNLVRKLSIQFYVVRVGELSGHIPKYARTCYLSYCRAYRNAVAHAYNKNQSVFEFNRSLLDLEQLQAELSTNTSPRFFSDGVQLPFTTLYVNKTYSYQDQDICLLAELRLLNISKQLKQHAPLLVCEPVELLLNTQLYSLLAIKIQQLDHVVSQVENAFGMLFFAVDCHGVKSVIAMKFVRDIKEPEHQLYLKEICFANVSGFNAIAQQCMDAIPVIWSNTSPQKNIPTVKMLDTVHINPEHELSNGALQVELFVHLAERRLHADNLLAPALITRFPLPKKKAKTPEERARQMDKMLLQLRSEHLELAWQHGHHEFYFTQQLVKISPAISPVVVALKL
jgi:hypothetical protein